MKKWDVRFPSVGMKSVNSYGLSLERQECGPGLDRKSGTPKSRKKGQHRRLLHQNSVMLFVWKGRGEAGKGKLWRRI